MTPDETRAVVLEELTRIAPEFDPASLRPDLSFRDQLDLDSMDLLNFAIALHKRLGVEIPESDYPRLATLNGCIAYLSADTPTGSQERAGSHGHSASPSPVVPRQ